MPLLHLITPEYPPSVGGVADYARRVAAGLGAQGESIEVWTPATGASPPTDPGVSVHGLELGFGPFGLGRLGDRLDGYPGSRRLFVQWVPHGFGLRSLNLPFCHWLRRRAAVSGDRVELMVHEPFLPLDGPGVRHGSAARLHRLMLATLLRSASRLFVATPAWGPMLAPYAFGHPLEPEWLPLPSTVPVVKDDAGRLAVRRELKVDGGTLIGHFGTFGPGIREALTELIPELMHRLPGASFLLIGKGSRELAEELRASEREPGTASRLHASGTLPAAALSLHLGACDLLVQPYPDGVSGRRTTALAGLAHGLAMATTAGPLTEPIWIEGGAVALAPAANTATLADTVAALATDPARRSRLGSEARRLYDSRFALSKTLDVLRSVLSDPPRSGSTR